MLLLRKLTCMEFCCTARKCIPCTEGGQDPMDPEYQNQVQQRAVLWKTDKPCSIKIKKDQKNSERCFQGLVVPFYELT